MSTGFGSGYSRFDLWPLLGPSFGVRFWPDFGSILGRRRGKDLGIPPPYCPQNGSEVESAIARAKANLTYRAPLPNVSPRPVASSPAEGPNVSPRPVASSPAEHRAGPGTSPSSMFANLENFTQVESSTRPKFHQVTFLNSGRFPKRAKGTW